MPERRCSVQWSRSTKRADRTRPGAARSLHASVVTFGREVDTKLDIFLEQ